MKKFALAALMVAGLIVSGGKAHADIVIDEFDAPPPGGLSAQYITVSTNSTVHNSAPVVASGSILGGFRDLEVSRQATSTGTSTVEAKINNGPLDFFQYSQNVTSGTVNGKFVLTYDAHPDTNVGNVPDPFDLTNPNATSGPSSAVDFSTHLADLTTGGNNTLQFRLLSGSIVGLLRIEIYTVSGFASFYEDTTFAAGSPGNVNILFSQFSDPTALSDVHAIRIIFDPVQSSTTTNLQLDRILATTTPEPSSIALLGIGIVGLVGRQIRRRKQA